MDASGLRTVKARWDLSNAGYAEPNRRLLIDLAFRLTGWRSPAAPRRAPRIRVPAPTWRRAMLAQGAYKLLEIKAPVSP
jgi:hypothetical protein